MAKYRDMTSSIIKEGYEGSVAARALERAGHCPQLKGHVHEIMFCDKFNGNPINIVKGHHAELTKSPIAKMKDIIIKDQHGKIVSHAQLKDTASSSGATKTAKQILDKHYSKTKVYGTKETVEKVSGKIVGKTGQKIHSSGISTETTQRVANKALGKMPTFSQINSAAKSGGVIGAAFGAGMEAVSSAIDVYNNKKSMGDAAMDIAGAGIKGGMIGAASSAAGSAAAGATGVTIAYFATTAVGSTLMATAGGALVAGAAPVLLGFAASAVVANCVSSLFD